MHGRLFSPVSRIQLAGGKSLPAKLSLPRTHNLCGKAFQTFAGSHDYASCFFVFFFFFNIQWQCFYSDGFSAPLFLFWESFRNSTENMGRLYLMTCLKCSTLILLSLLGSLTCFQFGKCPWMSWHSLIFHCVAVFFHYYFTSGTSRIYLNVLW